MNINFYSLFKIYIYLIFFFCFKDPEEYQSYEMVEPLENYFRPNMSLMIAVTMALDPNIDQSPVSHHYKEQTLHSILSQYFPETILLDNKGKRREENTINNDPERSILN